MALFGILPFCIPSGWKHMRNMATKEKEKLIEDIKNGKISKQENIW